jgi:hypothetical protein
MKELWNMSLCLFTLLLVAGMILTAGCATPHTQAQETHTFSEISELAFLRDGTTSREETLLRLGMPSAQFEGDRILTYQLRVDSNGTMQLIAPQFQGHSGFRSWPAHSLSLVLVFGSDGVLRKHSLVAAE